MHNEPETLPQVRAFIHGDCSADNLVIDEDGSVGVLDLECARFGDPLWDLAYQLFWGGAWPQMAPQARAAVAALEDTADHRARLRYYMVTAGLAGTGFYAHDGRAADVHLMVRRLAPLAEAPPSLTELEDYWMCLGR